MKISTSAATTFSGAVVALSLAASPAQAEKSAAPTPTLHGLADMVGQMESRISTLEHDLKGVHHELHAGNFQTVSYSPQGGGGPSRSYIIQTGDTISEIARGHNVSRADLMAVNQLKEGEQIYIGDELIIPGSGKQAPAGHDRQHHQFAANSEPDPTVKPGKTKPAPAPAPKPAPAPAPASTGGQTKFIDYKVRSGDSLSKIARNNKITVADIVRANKLNNADVLSVNQVLRIPTAAGTASSAPAPQPGFAGTSPTEKPAPAAPNSTPDTNADDFGLYEVQKGDTLWSLSRDFFTTQQEIQQLNNMGRSTILKPGQELVVPTKKYFDYHNRLSHSG